MAADIDYYIASGATPAAQTPSNANDGRDPWGHNQSIAAASVTASNDETYGSLLTLAGSFADYAAGLVARGGTTSGAVVALRDHVYISAFTGAATTTAGNFRVFGATDTTLTIIIQANSAYNAGTTYAAGDRVSYGGFVYASRLANNTGNAPSVTPKYWAMIDQVQRGAGSVTSLTGLSAIVLGTGPKLTVANAVAATVAGNRVYFCGNTSGKYETAATANFSKSGNYGTNALPIEYLAADWYGKMKAGCLLREGAKTKLCPGTGFPLNTNLATLGSAGFNVCTMRGLDFDGMDANGVKKADYCLNICLNQYEHYDLCNIVCCNFGRNNGNFAPALQTSNDAVPLLDRCVFYECAWAGYYPYNAATRVTGCVFKNTIGPVTAGYDAYGHGIRGPQCSETFTVTDCEFYGNLTDGLFLASTGNRGQAHVENCTAYNNGRHGFNLFGYDTAADSKNRIIRCSSVNNGGYGYYLPATAIAFADFNHAYGNASGDTNLSGGLPGLGNAASADPLFVNPTGDVADLSVKRLTPLALDPPRKPAGAGTVQLADPQRTGRSGRSGR